MTNETLTSEAESEVQETLVPEAETESFKKPSRVRKAVTGVLGGLGLFAAVHTYGAIAGTHNDQIRDAKAQEARLFDLSRAELVHVINLDENGEVIPEESVPVSMKE